MQVLILDNYDSFAYNLYQFLGELGAGPGVYRNDAIDLEGIRKLDPDAIVISPGPGHPANPRDFGVCRQVLLEVSPSIPTLGVCLGNQGIGYAYGGRVVRAPILVHGKISSVRHDGEGIFEGLPNPLVGGRYHSLMVDPETLPPELLVSARSDDGVIMGLRHRRYPVEGLQFHPESVLTPHGKDLLRNFLRGVKS